MKNIDVYHDLGRIDIKEIENFERDTGYRFPLDYKNLISEHNALRPLCDCFNFLFDGGLEARDVSFYGYGESIPDRVKVTRKQQEIEEYCHDHLVVIGESANGDYICFDYRNNKATYDPSVVLMLHDDVDVDGKMLVYPVANDFEAFIESLYGDG